MILSTTGSGGVRLRCRVEGPTDGAAVVLIHGWSQSLEAWDPLFDRDLVDDHRLVSYDLRGHGHSDAPTGTQHYRHGELWADDLAAVIESCCAPDQSVVLAAWSYGGFVVSDYLRHRGASRVAGIVYIGASISLDEHQVPEYLAPAFPPLAERASSTDPIEAEAAIRTFVSLCSASPLESATFEAIVASNLLTRPDVRAALGDRSVRSDDVLTAFDAPVLVIQGERDPIVLPATAAAIASVSPTAEVVEYEEVGHLPMVEAPDRLCADIRAFVARCPARSS